MMMALSKKNKRTCFLPGIVKEADLSANQVLSSIVENREFDMEKYLKKTDEIGHESEYDSIVKHEASVQNFMPDTFLLGKDKNKDTLAKDLMNNHSKQQEIEKPFVDHFNEKNSIQNFSSPSGVPSHEDVAANTVKYSEKLSGLVNSEHLQSVNAGFRSDTLDTQTSSTGNEAQMCGIHLAAKVEVARRSPLAYHTNDHTGRCFIREDGGTADDATNAVPEPGHDLVERSVGNTLSVSNLKPAKQSSQYVSVSPTKAKPNQKLNNDEKKENAKTEKRNKDASADCGGNVKHVTFEKLSPTSRNSTGK